MANKNSGVTYAPKTNSNIAKIATQLTDGSVLVYDTSAGAAAYSYVKMTLNGGALRFTYYNTNSTTTSGGSTFTTISGGI